MIAHEHDYEPLSYSRREPYTVSARCRVCNQWADLPASDRLKEMIQKEEASITEMHRVWHSFVDRFRDVSEEWLLTGYSLQKAVLTWAKEFRGDDRLHVVRCEDGTHSSSLLVLINHSCESEFLGTSLISIPQNSGDPCVMFLDERHQSVLAGVLMKIERWETQIRFRAEKAQDERLRIFREETAGVRRG